MHLSTRLSWVWMGAVLLVAIGSGCAGIKNPSDGAGGGGTHIGVGGHGVTPTPCNGPNGLCTDFPTAPDVDPGVATNIGGSGSGAGPCIIEPEDGSLFPKNWLRPRLVAKGVSGPVKITVHSAKEANDWVIYSANDPQKPWTMGKTQDEWLRMAPNLVGAPVTITVVGTSGGPSTTTFTVAPVGANGTMVFWAANPMFADIDEHACQTSVPLSADCQSAAQLRGFAVGDEKTEQVLGIGQVQQPSRIDNGNTAPITCIGCHSATPDKGFVTFADSYPWRTATASVQGASGTPPSGTPLPMVATTGGLAALQQPGWGPFSFSLNKDTNNNPLWQPGKRIGVGSLGLLDPTMPDYGNSPDQNDSPHLAWINLEAPNIQTGNNGNWAYVSYAPGAGIDSGNALGFIDHVGDLCGGVPCGAGMPSFSHDGATVVYVSTNAALSGRFNQENPNAGPGTGATQANPNPRRAAGMTNLFSVPFNGGHGGPATAINGAATTEFEEFYPALSPDDQYVAFTRVPGGQSMYANASAEVFVVPTGGGTATRLIANSPPACSGKTSPGVNNHWAKWSPDVPTAGGTRYYWMIFSSNRADIAPGTSSKGRQIKMSQLYLAPVVFAETGIVTYPAIYLWNQPIDSVNTTPAWESFVIPIIP